MVFMMISPLELRHLRTLAALRETGSVSRAAQQLCLTQSALSHQLRVLEEHYGAALFERKTQPLVFTPVGKRLLRLADTVAAELRDAETDIRQLVGGRSGQLRIAVECHTCFDWLMPAMDRLRERWPEIELDLVSGFHTDPFALLRTDRADLVILHQRAVEPGCVLHPLFRFEIRALLARTHALAARPWLEPVDFANETLITYPAPDDMIDVIRDVLRPAGVFPPRRDCELTVAIVQLVASRRGVAALPAWAVQPFVERGYVVDRPIGAAGLHGELYASSLPHMAQVAYVQDFLGGVRETVSASLPGIELLPSE
ncbi:LysR family transcriptional regulator for metE and metH [Plasticicumulans acidivorans]|uniref:HTH-type transcriptional regulator MetR n=2 Tax=Plasticicumulans acidivorans TaxID=886464 RepID=A0A317MZ94_9GAMM|nr:LysR family transcriptional regulator for metE and metH [Plasticicumulans acidivorans]